MISKPRVRFWLEAALTALTGCLLVLTLLWRDWIEAFGVDPDHHNGLLEWVVVLTLLALTLVSGWVAHLELAR